MRTHLFRLHPAHFFLGLLVFGLAETASATPAPLEEAVDISAVKEKLKILSDGKGHFIALVPFQTSDEYFFYGDGKTFFAQRTFGGGSEGTVAFNRYFWEPRVSATYKASLDFRERKYTLQCDERKTELQPLSAEEAATMVAAAKFQRPRWKHQAYMLARDNTGRYYYVDRMREPQGNKNFRLFAGPKGNIKLQKMINVVSDSEGDIFATKTGELRLVLDKKESTWIDKKTRVKLTQVPVEDNHILIYTDLGVYTGEPLGTPCDDCSLLV